MRLFMDILAKTTETEKAYRRNALLLERRFANDSGEDPHENPGRTTPLKFVEWFAAKAHERGWSKRTYWIYRASLLWFFTENRIPEAIEALKNTSSMSLQLKGTSTSSKKLKRMPQDMFKILTDRLEHSKGNLDKLIARWIRAGLACGLRPIEWEQATWNGEKNSLEVVNAKRDVYRGNGERRIIIYDPKLHGEEIAAITAFLNTLHEVLKEKSYREVYSSCRKRMQYIARRLWPKASQLPSLYSTRHQFAADMKASGLSTKEVAALMGHSSDETAQCHYARKSAGRKVKPPSTPAEEIGSVRSKSGSSPVQVSLINQS